MSHLDAFKAFAKTNKLVTRKHSNKVVIYTRVSTKEQADNNQSVEIQRKCCHAYAQENKLEVVAYFGGTFKSAKTDGREQFDKMLAYVKRSKEDISGIIVYSLDRFSRTGGQAITIAESLQQNYGVALLSATQRTDARTISGKFQQDMYLMFCNQENMIRREKCMAGTLEKLRNGEWPAMLPLGYDRQIVKKQHVITVNEKGKLLKKAFQWKAELRLSNTEIVAKLKALGLTITVKHLQKIFMNPFYCGILVHNLLEGEVIEGIHEKLVSQKVFCQVNDIQAQNAHGYTHQKTDNRLPLRNFLVCAICGTHLTGYEVKKKNVLYYKCNKIGCKVNKSAKQLHQLFEELLASFTIDKRLLAPLKDQLLHTFKQLNQQKEEEEKYLASNLKDIKRKLDKLEERFVVKEEISKEQWEKFSLKLKAEKTEIMKQLNGKGIKLSNLEKYIAFAVEMSAQLAGMWVSGDYSQRQKLQKLVFPGGIMYDREKDHYRTQRVNSIFALINSLSAENEDNKKGDKPFFYDLSPRVAATGIERGM